MWQNINKIAAIILTVSGLLLLPQRVIQTTGITTSGYGIVILIIAALGLAAAHHFLPWRVLRRFGAKRYKTDVILARKTERVSISKEYIATVRTEKTLVFPEKPVETDLLDVIEVSPGEKIDERVYTSSDSDIANVIQKHESNVAIYWKPKEPIVPLVPYVHKTEYRSPSLYGLDGFWQASHIDLRTGMIDWEFLCPEPVEKAVAFVMPKWRTVLTLRWIYRLALHTRNRGCEQPVIDSSGKVVRWKQINPKRWRTYICFVFYQGGLENIRKEYRATSIRRRVAAVIRSALGRTAV